MVLILTMVAGIVGYAVSTEAPLAFARSRIPVLDAGQPEPLQDTNQLVVVAFSDTTGIGPFRCPGCDKIYSTRDQDANESNPLPVMQFVVQNARTGEELGRQQAERQPQGRYQVIFQLPADLQDDVVLSLVGGTAGFELCPNAPASRTITPDDFLLGTHQEVYAFWTGCPLEAAPTATPVPPTPTPVPPTATPVPPSATPVPPTPTPVPPTATPLPPTATTPPTATPLPERSIVVEAFVDVAGPGGLDCPGCDRIFSSSDQVANGVDPLPNMDFVLRVADSDEVLARQTTTLDAQGRARTRFDIPAGFDEAVVVELASPPGNYQLCPTIGPSRTVQPDDFILGTHLEQFSFWNGCERPESTAPPSPAAPATQQSAGEAASPTAMLEPSLTATPLPEGQLTAVVTSIGLNVRAGPGVQFGRLGAVGRDTELALTGRDESGTWVQGRASAEDLEGWLSADFMDVEGDVMSLPVLEPEPTPTLAMTEALDAVVATGALNVRAGPGVGFDVLGAVLNETEVTLVGRNESGMWVRGQVPEAELEGWLSVPFLDIEGSVESLPVMDASGIVQPATPTPTVTVIPDKLPETGGLDVPLWGLLALASAILLAFSHVWRWARSTAET